DLLACALFSLILYEELCDGARCRRLQFRVGLHHLDEADDLPLLDLIAVHHVFGLIGCWATIEDSWKWRVDRGHNASFLQFFPRRGFPTPASDREAAGSRSTSYCGDRGRRALRRSLRIGTAPCPPSSPARTGRGRRRSRWRWLCIRHR